MIRAQFLNIADIPRQLRAQLREILPPGASLRRAKDGWLFSSDVLFRMAESAGEPCGSSPRVRPGMGDAPGLRADDTRPFFRPDRIPPAERTFATLSAEIARAGFESDLFAGMLLARPGAEWMAAFERAHRAPHGFFAASMARFCGLPPRAGAIELFADGLRLIESGDANERRSYLVRARQFAAVSLRAGGGGGYGIALLAGCIHEMLSQTSIERRSST